MKQEALTVIKGGLSRQRPSGGALKDAAFDLLNAYVTTEKTVKSRPGTTLVETLPAGTVGLTFFNGEFQIFASSNVGSIPSGYNLNILRAPDGEALSKIHFAEPFLGNLYVSAEFADGDIYHFWVRTADTWAATTEYELSDVVEPLTPNGFKYRPRRFGAPNPTWTANAPRTVGDKVEPTVYNGYYFEVVQTFGTNPASADEEPDWNDVFASQKVYESVDGATPPPAATPPSTPVNPSLEDDLEIRYRSRDKRLDPTISGNI